MKQRARKVVGLATTLSTLFLLIKPESKLFCERNMSSLVREEEHCGLFLFYWSVRPLRNSIPFWTNPENKQTTPHCESTFTFCSWSFATLCCMLFSLNFDTDVWRKNAWRLQAALSSSERTLRSKSQRQISPRDRTWPVHQTKWKYKKNYSVIRREAWKFSAVLILVRLLSCL